MDAHTLAPPAGIANSGVRNEMRATAERRSYRQQDPPEIQNYLICDAQDVDLRTSLESAVAQCQREDFGEGKRVDLIGGTALMHWPEAMLMDVLGKAVRIGMKQTRAGGEIKVYVEKGARKVLLRVCCMDSATGKEELAAEITKSGLATLLDNVYGRCYPEAVTGAAPAASSEAAFSVVIPLHDPRILVRSGLRHGAILPRGEMAGERIGKFMDMLKEHGLEDEYMAIGGHVRNLFSGRQGIPADFDVAVKVNASEEDMLRTRCEVLTEIIKGSRDADDLAALAGLTRTSLEETYNSLEQRLMAATPESPFYGRLKDLYTEFYGDRGPYKNEQDQILNTIRYATYLEVTKRYVLPMTERLEDTMGMERGAISDYVMQDGHLVIVEGRVKTNAFDGTVVDYAGFVTTDGVFHHARGRFSMTASNAPRYDQVGIWGNGAVYDPLGALDDYRRRITRLEFPLGAGADVAIRQVLRCFRIKHLALCDADKEAADAMYDFAHNESGNFTSKSSYWRGVVERRAFLDAGIAELRELVLTRYRMQNKVSAQEWKGICGRVNAKAKELLERLDPKTPEHHAGHNFLHGEFVHFVIQIEKERQRAQPTGELERTLNDKLEDYLYIPSDAGALDSHTMLYAYVRDIRRDPHFVAWYIGKIYRAALYPQRVRQDLEIAGIMPIARALSVNIDDMEEDAIDAKFKGLDLSVELDEGIALAEYMLDRRSNSEKWLSRLYELYKHKQARDRREGRLQALRQIPNYVADCTVLAARSHEEDAPAFAAREYLYAAELYDRAFDPERAIEVCHSARLLLQRRTASAEGKTAQENYDELLMLAEAYEQLSALEAKRGNYDLCGQYHRQATLSRHLADSIAGSQGTEPGPADNTAFDGGGIGVAEDGSRRYASGTDFNADAEDASARNFVQNLRTIVPEAESDRKLIVAFDTDIGNLGEHAGELFKALSEVQTSQGLENIRIVTGSGSLDLRVRIEKQLGEAGENPRVVIIARQDTVQQRTFDSFEQARIVSVNDSGLRREDDFYDVSVTHIIEDVLRDETIRLINFAEPEGAQPITGIELERRSRERAKFLRAA